MKSFNQYINIIEAKKAEMSPAMVKSEANKMIASMKPVTICDLLSDSNQNRLVKLYNDLRHGSIEFWRDCVKASKLDTKKFPSNSGWEQYIYFNAKKPKWYEEVHSYVDALYQWYEVLERKDKSKVAPRIQQMAKCGSKAGWASWSGKAYRGLARYGKEMAKYNLTGDITSLKGRMGTNKYLIAKVDYKSGHPIQSWTSKFVIADGFSMSGDGQEISVVIEIEIAKNEGFFSPEISNKLFSRHNEFEVLRLSNKPTTCMAYINMDNLISLLDFKAKDGGGVKSEGDYTKRVTKLVNGIFGPQNAKKILDPKHKFMVELMKKANL